MSFITDTQTLKDLHILGKYKRNSVFSLFNQTSTYGGERLLESMFKTPLTDRSAIQHRSALIAFFRQQEAIFHIDPAGLELAQNFVSGVTNRSYAKSLCTIARFAFLRKMGLRKESQHFEDSVRAVLRLATDLRQYLVDLHASDTQGLMEGTPLGQAWIRQTTELTQLQEEVEWHQQGLPAGLAVKCDYYLRGKWADHLQNTLEIIYYIDCYQSIAQVASDRGFVAAVSHPAEEQVLHLRNVYHPTIPHAIGNDLQYDKGKNLIFLTGANMAGKSTYMKSLGIAVYLAHLGFPVPAKEMHFSIKDGLYSSINVEDNLNLGHSHYYAEVLRVKEIAKAVHEGKRLVVIFDELFKGTNVKDAFEATLAVTRAFQQHLSCQYLISTHIVEVGEQLGRETPETQFLYLPTVMTGPTPTYTYKAEKGISSDKHGMVLIHKEHVLELLEKSKTTI